MLITHPSAIESSRLHGDQVACAAPTVVAPNKERRRTDYTLRVLSSGTTSRSASSGKYISQAHVTSTTSRRQVLMGSQDREDGAEDGGWDFKRQVRIRTILSFSVHLSLCHFFVFAFRFISFYVHILHILSFWWYHSIATVLWQGKVAGVYAKQFRRFCCCVSFFSCHKRVQENDFHVFDVISSVAVTHRSGEDGNQEVTTQSTMRKVRSYNTNDIFGPLKKSVDKRLSHAR